MCRCSGEPRCPLVPKLTRWLGSLRSGRRSKYSRSSRATSTSISFGAGLPASGEIAMASTFHRSRGISDADELSATLGHRARLDVPDAGRVFGDRAVAGELSRAGHIQDRLARPGVRVGIQLDQPLIRLQVRTQIRQVHVVVAVRQQRIAQWGENAWLARG